MLGTVRKRILGTVQLKRTLWKGLVIAVPLGVAFWLISGILDAVNILGDKLLGLFYPDRHMPWGLGLLIVLLLIYLVGRIEVHYEGREKSIWRTIKKKTLGNIPFVGPYFANANRNVVSLDDLRHLAPCKFWLSDTTPHYGFIVNEQKVRGADTELDVYRPNVPTIIPGDLFPLKKRYVIKLANPSGDILEKLASGGFISSKEEIPVPWDDETEEEFKERINLTPLEIAVNRILGVKANLPPKGTD